MSNALVPATALGTILDDPQQLKDFPIDTLKELKAMYDEERRENERRDFTEAFLTVQRHMTEVRKLGYNKHTKSPYAKAEDVFRMLDPLLLANGFASSFSTEGTQDGNIRFVLELSHIGGHTKTYYMDAAIDDTGMSGNPTKTKLQGAASSFTFCERHLLCKVFRVQLTEDNDGNAVRGAAKITEKQGQTIEDLLAETGVDRAKFLGWLEVEKLADLPQGRYQRAVSELEKRVKGE